MTVDPDDLAQRSRLPGLSAVLDPRDPSGARNRLIDRTHRRGLRIAARHIGVGRFATAVDLGCGVGRLTPRLLEHADRVVGLDPDPGMLERARDAHRSARVVFASTEDVPPLDSPTLVSSVYVLAQLPRDVVLDELRDLRERVTEESWLLLIERIARRGRRPVDIEPRSAAWYRDVVVHSGWVPVGARAIRREASVPVLANARLVPRLPRSIGRPVTTALAELEAFAAPYGSRGSYIDLLMWARGARRAESQTPTR